MNKKIIASASIIATAAILATTLIAGAQTTTTPSTTVSTPSTTVSTPSTTVSAPSTISKKMFLQVGAEGKVLMRGTIASVESGSLTVTSWGGAWTVNVGSSAKVLPVAVGNDLTQFKVGDFVGVQGTISQSSSWTIDATLVRDWTYRQTITQEQKQNVQSAHQTMKGEMPRNYVGTASDISGSSFTLTVGSTTYTVNVAAGAKVVNRNRVALPIANIQSGDKVRVWGINANNTITASIVRDVSIPAKSSVR
jgi:hypothetical protein